MSNSIQRDFQGPDWPLGAIAVVTPGTPVGIMSLVDPSSVNDPGSGQPPLPVGGIITPQALVYSYTVRAQQILFMAYKANTHGLQRNTGNIYITRVAVTGSGNRDDTGSIVMLLEPGQVWSLSSAPANLNVWSPYRYSIDADNAGDGALVTLIIQ